MSLVVANPARRADLADAGLRVLAADGARGLTHRAVDREAGLPIGTTANYFPSRDDLLGALGEQIFERLAPDPDELASITRRVSGVESTIDHIRDIVRRTTAAPELMVALFELRLEGRRRPRLAAILTDTLSRNFALDVAYNTDAGLPGGAFEIALLHYAVDGLLFDRLTTPMGSDDPIDDVAAELVRRLLAPARGR